MGQQSKNRRTRFALLWAENPARRFLFSLEAGSERFEFVSACGDLLRIVSDPQVSGLVLRAGEETALAGTIATIRSLRPDLEILCCGNNTEILEQLSREFDGFVLYSPDPVVLASTIRMVLDRCCARRHRGKVQCQHTRRSVQPVAEELRSSGHRKSPKTA